MAPWRLRAIPGVRFSKVRIAGKIYLDSGPFAKALSLAFLTFILKTMGVYDDNIISRSILEKNISYDV
jgi:hypothetical protein